MTSPDDLLDRLARVLDAHSRASDYGQNDDGSVDCFCGWTGYQFAKHQAERMAPVVLDWIAYRDYVLDVARHPRSIDLSAFRRPPDYQNTGEERA